jgi:hypothetical protein
MTDAIASSSRSLPAEGLFKPRYRTCGSLYPAPSRQGSGLAMRPGHRYGLAGQGRIEGLYAHLHDRHRLRGPGFWSLLRGFRP